MTEETRGPVAIRITRPYASEAEFLEQELDCIGRSGVVLVGAQQRPEGVILRFEVVLKGGAMVLRGEGRVVGYKAKALGDAPGLALRFTRLDSRSKALVDRAASLREARGRATPERTSVAPASNASVPSLPPSSPPSAPSSRSPPSARSAPLPPGAADVDPETTYVDSGVGARIAAARDVARPPAYAASNRDELLDRLRRRAQALDPAHVNALIPPRPKG